MKIYVMCEPSKFSKLKRVQKLHSSSFIFMVRKGNVFYHFVNTLMPISPAILDKTKQFKNIAMVIIRYF